MAKKKVDWNGWLKAGFVTGLVRGALVFVLVTFLATFFAFAGLGLPIFLLGGAAGIGAFVLAVVLNMVWFMLGRFLTQYTGWFSKADLWRVCQVAILGGLPLTLVSSLMSLSLNLMSLAIDFVVTFVITTVVLFLYKLFGWKLPKD